jgi:hypothetical protein
MKFMRYMLSITEVGEVLGGEMRYGRATHISEDRQKE